MSLQSEGKSTVKLGKALECDLDDKEEKPKKKKKKQKKEDEESEKEEEMEEEVKLLPQYTTHLKKITPSYLLTHMHDLTCFI